MLYRTSNLTYLEHAFGLLEQYERFFVVFALDKVVGCVGELSKDDRDLVLINLDLLIVHLVERVTFLRA